MDKVNYLSAGKWLYALAVLAIGLIIVVIKGFPLGLLPVSANLPGYTILVFLTAGILIIAAVLILIKKYTGYGAYLAAITWFILLIVIHLPKLLPHIYNGGEWTATFEVISLFSGACMLAGNKLPVTGRYTFALALVVFGVQHWLYARYIATLIPGWMPVHLFWSYFIMVVFFAVALSIVLRKLTHLGTFLLSLMFLLWVIMLHLPRVIAKPVETEWTSLFVALAMAGIALLVAGSSANE